MSRVKVDIFIPVGVCACQFAHFMDKVFNVLVKYRDQVEFEIKSSFSDEAKSYKIGSKGVVVNGTEVFSEYFKPDKLEKAIERAIKNEIGKVEV
ncbi:MAG: hypothetical protein KIH01_05040 [Candidatus Freyarchaeota archaeon]|nr:hypothetical protein [Candidatus Jordarchaeia archaeon]